MEKRRLLFGCVSQEWAMEGLILYSQYSKLHDFEYNFSNI